MNRQAKNLEIAFFSKKNIGICAVISIGYLLLSYWLIGFKSEQGYLVLLFNAMYFSSGITRKFITGFSVFIVFWIIFDYMKAFPNYLFQQVHIGDLYLAEKRIFGIPYNGKIVTPNEYWQQHHTNFLDIIAGISYLCWMPIPLAFSGYLFFSNRLAFLQFSLNFLLINLLGFAIYYLYPAAPPWYVQQYGFQFISSTPGNTAGLWRFDAMINMPVFQTLYSKSSNVFAAMPSLHAAYPLVVLYYGIKNKLGSVNIFFALIMAGIWFAALYTSHHYMLDILAGIACAIAGIILFQRFISRINMFKSFLRMFVSVIE
ncbi:MAG: phosphatase PAP2 family protein [Sediminibacterium sp.]|nr:phosphatase PAP2 family protein [Sediminibacterium sp.]MDP1810476.1 phosphatase PAP2 family protein [Sediminibacterium sp.]MDP3129547.1 phosphatase PAP2 family protein [Sediminibacterium sp.]MDP3667599.1 phosphatase PAP2 family protein [Sediminibacterium sp.]